MEPRIRSLLPLSTLFRRKREEPKVFLGIMSNLVSKAPYSSVKELISLSFFLKLRTAMINGETGSLSMDVKVPLDKGVRC